MGEKRGNDVFVNNNQYWVKDDVRMQDESFNLENSVWNENDFNKIFRHPCYAFRRGNIIFTSTPPSVDRVFEKQSTSICNINSTERMQLCPRAENTHLESTDFCEVCCGIRSPSFIRKAHTYTTHFCTRIPTKKNIPVSCSISDQRSKSIDSTTVSTSSAMNHNSRSKVSIAMINNFLSVIKIERCSNLWFSPFLCMCVYVSVFVQDTEVSLKLYFLRNKKKKL